MATETMRKKPDTKCHVNLATDETRMKHGFFGAKLSGSAFIRVQSVFHQWLQILLIREPLETAR